MNGLTKLSLATTTLIYLVIVLGAYTRAIGAGLACGTDWPLCKGYIIPPDILRLPVFLEYTHRVSAMATLILVFSVEYLVWTRYRSYRNAFITANAMALLFTAQVVVGAVVVVYKLLYIASMTHLAIATVTFGLSVATTIYSAQAG